MDLENLARNSKGFGRNLVVSGMIVSAGVFYSGCGKEKIVVIERDVPQAQTETSSGEAAGSNNESKSPTREVKTREISLSAIEDAYVDEYMADSNYGNKNVLLVTNEGMQNNEGIRRRSYLKFSLDDIPNNAEYINKAEIVIFTQNEAQRNGAPTINLRQIKGGWDESFLTWNNQPPIETFSYLTMNKIVHNDIYPKNFDITGVVRRWFEGSEPNYGVAFESLTKKGQAAFISKESGFSSVRPELRVTYEYTDIRK